MLRAPKGVTAYCPLVCVNRRKSAVNFPLSCVYLRSSILDSILRCSLPSAYCLTSPSPALRYALCCSPVCVNLRLSLILRILLRLLSVIEKCFCSSSSRDKQKSQHPAIICKKCWLQTVHLSPPLASHIIGRPFNAGEGPCGARTDSSPTGYRLMRLNS